MKKILFTLLLFTGFLHAQTYPVNPTKFGKISLNTNGVTTHTSRINSQNPTTGEVDYIDAVNLPVPTSVINAIKQKADLSTGLLKNGLISINADPTKFNISAGIGIISNFTDPENPVSTIINFPDFTAVTPAYLTTGNITYIAINSTPSIVMQASPFTPNQRRDLIVLGAVVHSNLTNINVVNNISAPSNTVGNQLHDFIEAVGALNLTGNKYSANGANLALNKSAGTIFKFGVNFATDWKNPHEVSQSAGTALTFRYRTQDGTEGTDRINLNPALYDLNNVLTTVPNNKFTIQTVTMFQTGLTRIQYGQNFYDNLSDARNAIFTRNYNVEANIRENGVTRAYIIIRNNATSLQNTTDAEIVEAQKFGGIASGGVSLTFANVVAALGYTPENIANKSDSYTASSTTTYPSTKALVDGLATKQNALINPITGTGTANTVPIFSSSTGLTNSVMYQENESFRIGNAKPSYSVGFSVSKNVDVINRHVFEDYSVINTTAGGEGWGTFDASTEMTGSEVNEHFNAYQSRLNYSSSSFMPTGFGYGMTGFLIRNGVTGTGRLATANGILIEDVYGVPGSIDVNFGLRINPQTRGVANYDLYSAGNNNAMGALTLGNPIVYNGVDKLVNSGSSLFGSLLKVNSGNGIGLNFRFNDSFGNTNIETVFDGDTSAGNRMVFKISDASGVANERVRINGGGSEINALVVSGGISVLEGVTGASFVKSGGLPTEYLMADGSVSTGTSSGGSIVSNSDNWKNKLRIKTPSLKLAFVGDSTSDLEGNAFSITEFMEKNTKQGFPLEGFDVANMPNYGSNGQSIVNFITDSGTKGLPALLASDLDLIIFSYGINDVRQNFLTKNQLRDTISYVINQIRAAKPDCDVILRMPNSFNIPTTDVYIKQGSYASLVEAAQAQSDILYNAYLELENKWDNVVLFNTQDLIFGRTSEPMTTALHSDEIHPRYDGIIDVLVNDFIGYIPEFRKEEAIAVISNNPQTPWVDYGRVFEKEPEFIKFGEGILQEQGTGYTRIETKPNGAYDINGKFSYNDYISFNKGEIVVRATDIGIGNQARVDYGQTLPTNTLENGSIVEFYKSRYNNTPLNQRYQEDTQNYPFRHKVKMGFCGTNFVRIDRFIDDDIITKKVIGSNPSDIISLSNAIIVFENQTSALSLSSASIGPVNTTQLQIGDITGDFSAFSDQVAYVYSSSSILNEVAIDLGYIPVNSADVIKTTGDQSFTGTKSSTVSGSSPAFTIDNTGSNSGVVYKNINSGIINKYENWATGVSSEYDTQTGATGDHIQFKNLGVLKSKIDVNGRYSIAGGSNDQYIMADGSTKTAYKVWTGTLNQVSTGAPTTTIFENTIGSIVWTRASTGLYFGTLTGAFPVGKTHLSITPSSPTGSYSIFRNTDDVIVVKTQDNGTTPFTDSDDKLFNNSIEIRVYP